MITKELAAIFALHVYDERVDSINLPKVLNSWTRIDPNPLLPAVTNGFAARPQIKITTESIAARAYKTGARSQFDSKNWFKAGRYQIFVRKGVAV